MKRNNKNHIWRKHNYSIAVSKFHKNERIFDNMEAYRKNVFRDDYNEDQRGSGFNPTDSKFNFDEDGLFSFL
jgi:hypothetical protein